MVQFGVILSKLGSPDFAEKGWMFLKIYVNLLKRGSKFQKTRNDIIFYFGLYVFPNIFMHFWNNFLEERKK